MAVNLEIPRRHLVKIVSPGAGANYSIQQTGLGSWVILSMVYQLVTSAVAGNRLSEWTVDDGSDIFHRFAAGAVQAASLTQLYTGFVGSSGAINAGNVTHLSFRGDGLWLPAGFTLKSVTQNIDVGDQYSALALYVEELPTGPSGLYYPNSYGTRQEVA